MTHRLLPVFAVLSILSACGGGTGPTLEPGSSDPNRRDYGEGYDYGRPEFNFGDRDTDAETDMVAEEAVSPDSHDNDILDIDEITQGRDDGICEPNCQGRNCGGDGCGGTCGECDGGKICIEGVCTCEPKHHKDCCGDNVCWFDSCGQAGEVVAECRAGCANARCKNCVPQCDGKECGPDQCGGECGDCPGSRCDGLTFLLAEKCAEGSCVPSGPDENCEGWLVCTDNYCDPVRGCLERIKKNYCLIDLVCHRAQTTQGKCLVCDPAHPTEWSFNEGHPCDDGNPCSVNDQCRSDVAGGPQCIGTRYSCDAPGPCETAEGATCNGDGTCTYRAAVGVRCDDGDPCTINDVCQADKSCRGSTYQCDSPGFCQTKVGAICNGDGTCTYQVDVGAACNDKDLCTFNDVCMDDGFGNGICAGTAYACETPGFCEKAEGATCKGDGTCNYPADAGAPCDDELACTYDDKCLDNKSCVGTFYMCDDPPECATAEGATCNGDGTCNYPVEQGKACNDANPCTIDDHCQEGQDGLPVCLGTLYECDSPGFCETSEGAICNGDGTCNYPADINRACDDGDPCTYDDNCRPNKICLGTSYSCDEPGLCETADGAICNGDGTCTYEIAVWESCDDGDACTFDDVCQLDGSCVGVDYSCDNPPYCGTVVGATCNGDGTCKYPPDSEAECDDHDPCTWDDKCKAGAGGVPVCQGFFYTCSLPGACETAVGAMCNGDGTCYYPPNTDAPCDDGDLCTYNDTCKQDKTCSGVAYTCEDPGFCETAAGAACLGNGDCLYYPDPDAADCDAPGYCETMVGAKCLEDRSCSYPPAVGRPCNDANMCTHSDACDANKQCTGTVYQCKNRLNPDCNGIGGCYCLHESGSSVCDDRSDVCDPEIGCICSTKWGAAGPCPEGRKCRRTGCL